MNRIKYALKNCASMNHKELTFFILSSFLSGFILSFRKWGTTKFNPIEGVTNLILYAVLFFILYFIFIIAQKFLAAYMGYACTYNLWPYGPLAGGLITFMTYGWVPFLYLGCVELKDIPSLKLGQHRQAVNVKDLMFVGIIGPFAVLLIILFVLMPLYFATQSIIFSTAVIIGATLIFFSSLPLPNTNGMNVIVYSRGIWITYFGISALLLILLLPMNFVAYLIVLIFALGMVWLFGKYLKHYF